MIEPAILYYCKYQERCHSEVRNKLFELGFTTIDVEKQLSELIEVGVLNEERFAKAFARGRWRMKQWGKNKIIQQLKLRKVSDYCIKKGLSEIDGVEYEQVLSKLALKKATELKKERSLLQKKMKIYRYLVQKGYEQDMVKDAIDIVLDKK